MPTTKTTEIQGWVSCPGPSEVVGSERGAQPRSIDPRLCVNHVAQKARLLRDETSWTHSDLGGEGNQVQTSNVYLRLADGDPTCPACGSHRILTEAPPAVYRPRNAMYGPYSLVDQRRHPNAGANLTLGRIEGLENQIAALQDRDVAAKLQAQIDTLKAEKPKAAKA